MRAEKLRQIIREEQAWNTNVIDVVEVKDWAWYKERDAQQEATLALQSAEIGQLRMLLKQSAAQMEQWATAARANSPEYHKLVKRIETVLAHTTAVALRAPESVSEAVERA